MNKNDGMHIEVEFRRDYLTGLAFVEVRKPGVSAQNIWMMTMGCNIRVFSFEELRIILLECKRILSKMPPASIPLDYYDLAQTLEEILDDSDIRPSLRREADKLILEKIGVPNVDELLERK